ncbi:hypothetical protein [Cupriavidus sp. CuC1]|uniref:hypothetical protein n=1 Tax=Cupriavidus sp. CuC1 TaxID=3373131 RepID=UPI0037D6210E
MSALGIAAEQMRQNIQRFLIIVQAISAESRLDQLPPVLLRKLLNAAGGDAGVLYLADGETLNAAVAFDRNGAAADRPYKKAKTLSESVRIMSMATAQHHLDPDLFALFLTSCVYRRYAERFMRPEQIDEVDIALFVANGVRNGQAAA